MRKRLWKKLTKQARAAVKPVGVEAASGLIVGFDPVNVVYFPMGLNVRRRDEVKPINGEIIVQGVAMVRMSVH